MKERFLYCMVIYLLTTNLYSQNLIRNSSFDEVLPYSHSDNHSQQRKHFTDNARFWNTPTGGTPDIVMNQYRSDPKYDRSLGINEPRTGESMIGVRVYGCYKNATSHCREYIQTKTISTLKKGKCYEYEFYVLPSIDGVRINGLGIGLTEYEMDDMSKTSILGVEQLIVTEDISYEGVGQWVKISGNFTPTKDFNHISLGNYYKDNETEIRRVENGSKYGYYYIDDVSLYKVDCKNGERELGLDKITIKDMFFESNSFKVNQVLSNKIKSIYEEIKNLDYVKITINGHTDASGTKSYNKDLSLKRAEAILSELESLGVPRSKMIAIGHGSDNPVDSNNEALNRRVEIVIDKREH